MNLWQVEKDLIELKKNSLLDYEKEIVLELFKDMEYHRYLLVDEMRLFSRLKGSKVIPRGQA